MKVRAEEILKCTAGQSRTTSLEDILSRRPKTVKEVRQKLQELDAALEGKNQPVKGENGKFYDADDVKIVREVLAWVLNVDKIKHPLDAIKEISCDTCQLCGSAAVDYVQTGRHENEQMEEVPVCESHLHHYTNIFKENYENSIVDGVVKKVSRFLKDYPPLKDRLTIRLKEIMGF